MISSLTGRFRALSDPTRVLLLGVLLDEELTVGELAQVVDTAQPGVSRHLSALREAGFVVARRQGAMTFYRVRAEDGLLQGGIRQQIEAAAAHTSVAQRVDHVLQRRRARAQAFFEKHGAGWDELRGELLHEAAVCSSLLPLVPRGLRVVDIGTGTGAMLPYLAEIADQVVGIDPSRKMLRFARQRARRLGIPQLELHVAHAEKLPLRSGVFDAAFAVLVLHHVSKPVDAVLEMARVVRPGGHVIVLDLCSHGQEWLRETQADLWLGFARDEIETMFQRARLVDGQHKIVSRVASPRGGGNVELFVASAHKKPK